MKTKIMITTVLLLLFSVTSFAQTKEETIAWIKEKLEKHGGNEYYSYINVKVSPCSISFTGKFSKDGDTIYQKSFNPSTAKSWEVSSSSISGIGADAAIIRTVFSDGDLNTTSALDIRNGESDIHERMIKALLHLATFCEEGKNEAF